MVSNVNKWIFPVLVSAALLILFFWFKAVRFERLYYFYNDMYAFLQSASSWLDGRPLLYENVWGYDDRIHNNYILLAFGPFIHKMGAYGAFAIQMTLMLFAYMLVVRRLSIQAVAPWIVWSIVLVVLLGPVWFWFNEHPGIGWHPELTYLPTSLLFAMAVPRRSWVLFAVSSLLMVAVKEDGALLGGCLHLLWLGITFAYEQPGKPITGVLRTARFWRVVASWAIVFVLGMIWLSVKNNAAKPEPRLQKALETILMPGSDFWARMAVLLAYMLLLLSPIVLLWAYVVYRLNIRQWGRLVLAYSAGLLALTLSNAVQGATYFTDNPYFDYVSITWPPRFVVVFAYSACFLILTVLRWSGRPYELRPTEFIQSILVIGLLVYIQVPIIEKARPDFRFEQVLKGTFASPFDPQKQRLLPPDDVAVLQRLAQQIPPRSDVFAFDYVIPFFHKHYLIWPTDKQWRNADLAIIPIDDFQKLSNRLPKTMNGPYQSVNLRAYRIYYTSRFAPYVQGIR